MPYLDHFGLTDYPFQLTPDVNLYYPDDHAQALLGALMFAVLRGDGLLKVVGEVGSGKTLLARKLVEKFDGQKVKVGLMSTAGESDPEKLPLEILRAFDPKAAPGKTDPADRPKNFLTRENKVGNRCLLIVDEAQALGMRGLEAVRLLSNLETEKDKLLQIVLFGQPELDALLQKHELRQVAQRINFTFSTHTFSEHVVADYIRFRIERSAKPETSRNLFSEQAVRKIAASCRGLPRIVHLLADKALLAAYAEGSATVELAHVKRAIKETPDLAIRCRLIEMLARLRHR
jgi:MSHA biogenesis protein MshM